MELNRQSAIRQILELPTDDSLDLIVQHVQGKGLGVVAGKDFDKDEPVVEYAGELISQKDGLAREKQYASEGRGCYLFFFKSKDANLW